MNGSTVVISGASSGIGKACALHLDRLGYRVFAGVRKTADGQALLDQASERLSPLLLDVTDEASLAEAAGCVRQATGGVLSGLVNNAGIGVRGPLEYLPLVDFRRQIEVNLTGQLAVTQAFLPLLRAGRGKILMVSSTAGRLATPFLGPYAASKAGLAALADAMRMELAPWKLPVSVLVVGSIRTPIWDKATQSAEGLAAGLPPEAQTRYGEALKRSNAAYDALGRAGLPTEQVARVVARLLGSRRPPAYKIIGWDAWLYELVARCFPTRLRDWSIRLRMGL
jgi:NAD(P)-dependent dehydrogenase (short-subunit alcohol dehydrogenase family)